MNIVMQTPEQTAKTPAWKSPWVIWWVLSIVIVLGVNLFMVYLAVRTHPGLVVEDYYERGQSYEKNMVSRMLNDPGWHLNMSLPSVVVAGEETPVQFTILDKAGMPLQPQSVTFYAYRPSDVRRDFSVPMEQETKGLYKAKAQFRLKGVWDLMVSAQVDGQEYSVGRRLRVEAPN